MKNKLQQGLKHHRLGQYARAEKIFRKILTKHPKNADAIHFLGLALWHLTQQPQEPLKLMRQSLKLAPKSAAKHHNIAAVIGSLGQLNEAAIHYKKAIALKPDYAEAFFNLGNVYKFKKGDPLIAKMQSLYAANNLTGRDYGFLSYALSKAMNDVESYHEAFHFCLEGARTRQAKHNLKDVELAYKETHTQLTKNFLKPNPGRGDTSQSPVFIVGMPRSGTTLVETILSRHHDVLACGELQMIGSINQQMRTHAKNKLGFSGYANGYLPRMPSDHFANAAQSCLTSIKAKADGQSFIRFTDKMPHNIYNLGLIALMFPNARIIHVKRHPLDTCVSCFFQRFRSGHDYSYNLQWLGHYYRYYAKTMDHWHKVLPLPIFEVGYEDLIANPEEQSQKLVEFLDLVWSDACLSPQNADRSVLTASRWQVRQPIYNSSLQRWKRYEPYLEPLIDSLGGWQWINAHVNKQNNQT